MNSEIVKVFPRPDCDICKHYGVKTRAVYDARMAIGDWFYMCQSCFEKNGIGLGHGLGYKLELVTDKIDKDFNELNKIEIRITHLNLIIESFEVFEHLVKPIVLSIFSYEDDAIIEVFDYKDNNFHVVDRGKTTMHGSLSVVISIYNHRIYYNMPAYFGDMGFYYRGHGPRTPLRSSPGHQNRCSGVILLLSN
ncbi:MAG: hypothetical protein LWX55_17230 [Deltaproteobacteria bacterium]|jgi:hypothetical protein|nr:hypothetical protein [Deltaproteobacteria bacterium]